VANKTLAALAAVTALVPLAAQAQEQEPRRTRVIVGPQLTPSYPGADGVSLRPYFDISRTRGDRQFAYEAPDESTSLKLYNRDGLTFGPALGFEGRRRSRDVGGLDKVGFSVELGAALQYQLAPSFRLFVEGRKGVSGHKGVTGMVGIDYVARDADRWLWSIGPRVTLADNRYARAYFGVTPAETARTGIASYRPDGGVTMFGGTTSVLRQLSPRWGVFGFAKYDRLIGDAADSPVVRRFGSRDQWTGGGGITYTFGRGVR
jgi:outer membrane protein